MTTPVDDRVFFKRLKTTSPTLLLLRFDSVATADSLLRLLSARRSAAAISMARWRNSQRMHAEVRSRAQHREQPKAPHALMHDPPWLHTCGRNCAGSYFASCSRDTRPARRNWPRMAINTSIYEAAVNDMHREHILPTPRDSLERNSINTRDCRQEATALTARPRRQRVGRRMARAAPADRVAAGRRRIICRHTQLSKAADITHQPRTCCPMSPRVSRPHYLALIIPPPV